MQLTSVLLPEPFGPIRPSRSPARDLEVDAVERDEAAEALAEPVDVEQRRAHARASGSGGARRRARRRDGGKPEDAVGRDDDEADQQQRRR